MDITIAEFEEVLDKRFLANKKEMEELLNKKFDEKLVNFATKEDLKSFATKDDLKAMEKSLKDYADQQTDTLAAYIAETVAIPLQQHLEEHKKIRI